MPKSSNRQADDAVKGQPGDAAQHRKAAQALLHRQDKIVLQQVKTVTIAS